MYYLFKGELELQVTGGILRLYWIKKPLFTRIPNCETGLEKVIRWKFETGGRGPDNFILIFDNGRKIHIRPAMFSSRNFRTELWLEFDTKMASFNAHIPKEDLYQKVLNSDYIRKIDQKLKLTSYLSTSFILLGLTIAGALFFIPPELQPHIWILLVGILLLCLFLGIYYESLRYEKRESLTMEEDMT